MTSALAVKNLTSAALNTVIKLQGTLNPVWRIMTCGADNLFLPEKNLCICIEKDTLSAAYGIRFLSLTRIKEYKKYQYQGYPQPEEAASSAILALSELKADGASVTLNIPKEWVVIKTAELPLAAKENLAEVVLHELDRLTPFSAENTLYDFRVIHEDDKKMTILLAAAKADLVNKYIEALRGKNIIVNCVRVNLSGIGNLLDYIDGNKDCIYMEIQNYSYECALFINGSLMQVFTGNFINGDDNSKIEIMMKEIAPLLDSVKKPGRAPQVLLSLKNMPPSFKEVLKLKTDMPYKLLGECNIKPGIPGHINAIPYYAVGGVLESLSHKTDGFNLLTKGSRERQKTPVVLTIILLLVIAGLGVLNMVIPLKTEEKKLVKIDSDIALRKKEIKKFEWLTQELKNVNEEISDIQSFKASRQPSIVLIKELTSLLPQSAWLTRIHISGTALDIEGYADSATALLPKLEASNYFKKVEFASQTFRDVKKGIDRFQIRMEIEGAKKIETIQKNEEELTDEEL